MTDRRRFLQLGLAGTAALATGCAATTLEDRGGTAPARPGTPRGPVFLSTWDHGLEAARKGWDVLQAKGTVLDAVEQGVMLIESDLSSRSVGLGGLPDRDGRTTLDACIQTHEGLAGAVACLEDIEHPISVARAIMERTPHVMLVGEGAKQWALENGFPEKKVDLPEVRQAWQEWLAKSAYKPVVNIENHDTIGLLGVDGAGRLAGSCTTSGLAFKIHGRVGDSPIIGSGLFVDGDVGAACATGLGELVIRVAGSHTVVELMRQGMGPDAACKEAVQRILRKNPDLTEQQVGFLALRKDGAYGAHAIYSGFNFAVRTMEEDRLLESPYERKWG